ncbi:helix-turn-helix domain-containing protein [Chitinophaga qingshengii]|uniref:AraC family transcriptional regulator n=1 Tax=Chitinophaga qingshengii TaxID=1569794 RepID=A0ABR7TMS7_9BACT|nr:helix-turn-helix domain-containing protein [Chitinophaga qingshengii]MBC9931786.1 AraC family transcriptional regulator [Chitinophaga qingshengii]
MQYQTFQPSARFRGIVRSYWILESDEPYTHHSMADMCPELLFHYNGRFDELLSGGAREASFTAGIHGQCCTTRKFNINQGFGMFGVYLYPQAIPLLFNIPASELTNQMPDLTTILAGIGQQLEEKIALAGNHPHRIRILEDFFAQRLSGQDNIQPPVFEAIRTIIQRQGAISVKQLAQDHYLSTRQFERQFMQYAGLSPKMFSRIARFHAAIKQYGPDAPSLTQIALECGYYDQSHFIHDFRAFSGEHPKAYFSGRSGATAWMD